MLPEPPEIVPLRDNISGRTLKFFHFERDFKGSQADSSHSCCSLGSAGCNETGKAGSDPLCAPFLAEKYPNIVEVNGNCAYFVLNALLGGSFRHPSFCKGRWSRWWSLPAPGKALLQWNSVCYLRLCSLPQRGLGSGCWVLWLHVWRRCFDLSHLWLVLQRWSDVEQRFCDRVIIRKNLTASCSLLDLFKCQNLLCLPSNNTEHLNHHSKQI